MSFDSLRNHFDHHFFKTIRWQNKNALCILILTIWVSVLRHKVKFFLWYRNVDSKLIIFLYLFFTTTGWENSLRQVQSTESETNENLKLAEYISECICMLSLDGSCNNYWNIPYELLMKSEITIIHTHCHSSITHDRLMIITIVYYHTYTYIEN